MHTKDILAEELDRAGLPAMAAKARKGEYHDFLSPHDLPSLVLDADLLLAIEDGNQAATELRRRHHNGDFDASAEEGEEWWSSPEGQEAQQLLMGERPPESEPEKVPATWATRHEMYNGTGVFAMTWIIQAPWAHPHWHQYLISLYDLTTPYEKGGPVKLYLPNATHEFILWALHPKNPFSVGSKLTDNTPFVTMEPPNYGYQFQASSNEAAVARVQEIVDGIVDQKLSPDTDFRSLWNKLLPDAYPLVH